MVFGCRRLNGQVTDVRTVFPPSPTATSMLKFTEVPVSKFTGLPGTNVPVWTIHSGQIDLPVALQYHSGGVRVTEAASWVGMGWALNFGGVISQSIRGNRDDFNNGRLNTSAFDKINPSVCDLYDMTVTMVKDGEPDMFSFSFNDMSGSFILDDNRNVVQIPEQKIKIEPLVSGSGTPYMIYAWKITDLNGNQYFFEEIEETLSSSKSIKNDITLLASTMGVQASQSQRSWYVSKIIDVGGNEIDFSYDTYNSLDYIYASQNKQFLYDQLTNVFLESNLITNYQMQNIPNGKRIRTITFRDGRIEFIPGGNRCDVSGEKYLDKIDVYNSSNERIKELSLNYKYFVGSNMYNISDVDCSGQFVGIEIPGSGSHNYFKDRRLFLSSVDEIDNSNSKVSAYSFDYENSLGGLPDRFSSQQDWWGLYNGNGYSSLLTSLNKTSDGSYDILGRNANLSYAKQGILKKITYPTGGSTEFDFELNSMSYPFGPTYALHPQVVYSANGQNSNQLLGSLTVDDHSTGSVSISFQVSKCIFGPNGTSATGFYIQDANGNQVVSGSQVVQANQQTNNGQYSFVIPNGSYQIYSYAAASFPCNYSITVFAWTEQQAIPTEYTYGGLRVKKVTSFDPVANKTLVNVYDYTKQVNNVKVSSGTSSVQLGRAGNNYASFQSTGECNCGGTLIMCICGEKVIKTINVTSNTNYPLGTNQNGYIGYSDVTEKHLDGQGNDLGYTYTAFETEPKDVFIGYSNSKALTDGGLLPQNTGITSHSLAPSYLYSWARGKVLKNHQFVRTANNTYQPVHKEDNIYSPLSLSGSIKAVAASYLFASAGTYTSSCGGMEHDYFAYTPYEIWTGHRLLESVVVQDIDNNLNAVTTTTNYTYNNTNFLPATVTVTNSRSEKVITNLKYPLDYSISTTPSDPVLQGIQNLQNAYAISPVIEKYMQKSNIDGGNLRTISAVLNTYKSSKPLPDVAYIWEPALRNTGFAPLVINGTAAVKDANYSPKISFDSYDVYGNLLQQKKVNNVTNSYVWDYNSVYPIAEVTNANLSDIAFTSFEADGNGNWIIFSPSRNSTNFFTGKYSYNLSDGNISKSGLNIAQTYILSYWGNSNTSASINGTTIVSKLTRNGWYYFEHKIPTNVSSITISGSVTIDELRLYPLSAQMKTYTYAPLVGITSECNSNNSCTYFEYDNSGRLSVVRDQDRNIIKKIAYQYSTQP